MTFDCMTILHRYRAVASWSRVQGVGIPLLTVFEIVSIWLLSLVLAVPEAICFDMVQFEYRNQTIRTCMLNPKGVKAMEVRLLLIRLSAVVCAPRGGWVARHVGKKRHNTNGLRR